MKSYIIVAALSVLTGGLSAQTSIEDVLRSVEANNKDLQANSQLVQSQKLEAEQRKTRCSYLALILLIKH